MIWTYFHKWEHEILLRLFFQFSIKYRRSGWHLHESLVYLKSKLLPCQILLGVRWEETDRRPQIRWSDLVQNPDSYQHLRPEKNAIFCKIEWMNMDSGKRQSFYFVKTVVPNIAYKWRNKIVFIFVCPTAKWRCCDVTMRAVYFWGQGRGLPVGRECSTCDWKRK